MDILSILIVTFSLPILLVKRKTDKFIYFAVLCLVAVILHATLLFGTQILYLLLITYVVSTITELISLKTPLNCFGVKYSYDLDKPLFSSKINILGVYPLEISLAWVLFKYASFVIALLIVKAFSVPYFLIIFLTPLILVSLDLIIDPVAVNKMKLWKWERGSSYFGIPIQNFIGWYLVGLASSLVFSLFDSNNIFTLHPLHVLPVIFYGMLIRNIKPMFAVDKGKAIIGSLPAVFWTILGTLSLVILYLRQA